MTKQLVNVGRIFLAIMFLFSGISKLISLPFFDGMVAELFLGADYYDNPSGLFYTQWLSRILIALELVLGAAMLQEKWIKKLALPGIMGMLLLFTVHLFYEGLTSDKGFIEGNCGCFGDVLPMNNLESIIKNVVALVVGALVWKSYTEEKKMATWVAPFVIGLVTLGTLGMTVKKYESVEPVEIATPLTVPELDSPFMETNLLPIDSAHKAEPSDADEPVDEGHASQAANQSEPKTLPENPPKAKKDVFNMINTLGSFSDGKALNVSKGEHLVCLFSMTCGHCQESFKEMCEMKQYAGLPVIHLVNFGKEFEQNYFFNQAGNCKPPYLRTEDYTQFNRLLEGKGFPRIIAVKDGKIVNEWNIDSYNKESFMKFYGIKEKEESGDGLKLQKKDDDSFDEFEKKPWE